MFLGLGVTCHYVSKEEDSEGSSGSLVEEKEADSMANSADDEFLAAAAAALGTSNALEQSGMNGETAKDEELTDVQLDMERAFEIGIKLRTLLEKFDKVKSTDNGKDREAIQLSMSLEKITDEKRRDSEEVSEADIPFSAQILGKLEIWELTQELKPLMKHFDGTKFIDKSSEKACPLPINLKAILERAKGFLEAGLPWKREDRS